MQIREEFTGMLSGAIEKFEELLAAVPDATVTKGYDCTAAGKDSFFAWGCACRMSAPDMVTLRTEAENLGITWLSDDGDMAYTGGRTIADFQTYRVNGSLELMPEEVF